METHTLALRVKVGVRDCVCVWVMGGWVVSAWVAWVGVHGVRVCGWCGFVTHRGCVRVCVCVGMWGCLGALARGRVTCGRVSVWPCGCVGVGAWECGFCMVLAACFGCSGLGVVLECGVV